MGSRRRGGANSKTYLVMALGALIMGFALGRTYGNSQGNDSVLTLVLAGGGGFLGGILGFIMSHTPPIRLAMITCSLLGLGVLVAGFSIM